ncbi:MAG TPA: carbon-nitrogen hydrolase family protein [Gammaproteobacteria bacterium]|nr:carbon-nitrogen hydrolase family protein [Gammaproteobacteria bacterium]
MTLIAAVQMASGPHVTANLIEAEKLIGRAAAQGAELAVLPENFAIMGMSEQDKVKIREAPGRGPIQDFLAQTAKRHGIWLVGGTIPLEGRAPNKVRAACTVFDPQGRQVARYDKIHLFDVTLEGTAEKYTESATIEPGEGATLVETPFARMGLAVCYDLRFPELFRQLLDQGMELLALPSAFTAVTGRAHWEVLVRARAIENLCYVIAPAQGGYHINGRETHGESMIVDPWGNVLDRLSRGSGVVVAEFDRARVASIRHNFPAVRHRRLS